MRFLLTFILVMSMATGCSVRSEGPAVRIARRALLKAGYRDIPEHRTVHFASRSESTWLITFDYAPAGGGKHVNVFIDGETGEVVEIKEGLHSR